MNWYNGNYPIHELQFATCEVAYIYSNAFAGAAFRNLTVLTFYDKYTRLYHTPADFLNGLHALKSLAINKVILYTNESDIFHVLKRNLEQLILINATISATIPKIFVNAPFVRLRLLTIKDTPFLRRITSKTFGQLPAIVRLELDNCGVEFIEFGAFDQMPATLDTVSLRSNQLQTLPTNLLARLGTNLILGLSDNPWACQCFLLELNTKYHFLPGGFHRRCNWLRCRPTENELGVNLCKERSCIYHPGTAAVFAAYPKFTIKLLNHHDENTIRIDGKTWPNTTKLYVVILMVRSTVFENEFESICFAYETKYAPFLIAYRYLHSHVDQPQILHVLNGVTRVWLLNIASIQPQQVEMGWLREADIMRVSGIAFGLVLFAFCLGLVLGFVVLCFFPILLQNLDRVVVLHNRNVGEYRRKTQVFIMPKSWRGRKPLRESNGIGKKDHRYVNRGTGGERK